MLEIIWNGTCNFCYAPLDLFFMCDTQKEFDILDEIDIECVDNNDSRYKFVDKKPRKVCLACFRNAREHKRHRKIVSREIGTKSVIVKHKSMSQSEIKDWFFSLKKYFNE
jgi:hypothetical protein